MRYFLLGFLVAQTAFLALIYAPAAASGSVEQVERSIAYSPVEIACSWQSNGLFIGCLKGTRDVSAPPGTPAQLKGGIITHNQPAPYMPTPDLADVQTALRNGWGQLRLVQGRYRRGMTFNSHSTTPDNDEYARTFENSLKKHGVWFQHDPTHLYLISGPFSAILAAGDETWDTLAVRHQFEYRKGLV